MFRATQEIYDAFREEELKCHVVEKAESSYVVAEGRTKLTNLKAMFISKDDDSDVAMRLYDFVQFDEALTEKVMMVTNEINTQYRYLKFYVDTRDNSVTVEWDFPVRCDNVGAVAVEMLFKLIKVTDDIYREFMKAIWG